MNDLSFVSSPEEAGRYMRNVLENTDKGDGPFHVLHDSLVGMGSTALTLVISGGIFVVFFALILAGKKMSLGESARTEAKEWLKWIAIGTVCFFSMYAIVELIMNIASSVMK